MGQAQQGQASQVGQQVLGQSSTPGRQTRQVPSQAPSQAKVVVIKHGITIAFLILIFICQPYQSRTSF